MRFNARHWLRNLRVFARVAAEITLRRPDMRVPFWRFMAFVLRPEVQQSINMATDQIPVNKEAKANDNRFIGAGKDLLSNTKHLAQFFDRDTSEDLATSGMKGFQEFMMNPSREDKVLDDLERTRKRVYGALQ